MNPQELMDAPRQPNRHQTRLPSRRRTLHEMEDGTFQEGRRLLIIELVPVPQHPRFEDEEDEEEDGATPLAVTPIPMDPMDVYNAGATAMEIFGRGGAVLERQNGVPGSPPRPPVLRPASPMTPRARPVAQPAAHTGADLANPPPPPPPPQQQQRQQQVVAQGPPPPPPPPPAQPQQAGSRRRRRRPDDSDDEEDDDENRQPSRRFLIATATINRVMCDCCAGNLPVPFIRGCPKSTQGCTAVYCCECLTQMWTDTTASCVVCVAPVTPADVELTLSALPPAEIMVENADNNEQLLVTTAEVARVQRRRVALQRIVNEKRALMETFECMVCRQDLPLEQARGCFELGSLGQGPQGRVRRGCNYLICPPCIHRVGEDRHDAKCPACRRIFPHYHALEYSDIAVIPLDRCQGCGADAGLRECPCCEHRICNRCLDLRLLQNAPHGFCCDFCFEGRTAQGWSRLPPVA